MSSMHPVRRRQRGAIAIVVGLMLVVLVGFVGLALDGGRLYLTKTELQNAADACALAASYELTDAPSIPPEAFARADAAGRMVAQRDRVNFQQAPIASGDVSIGFSTSLGSGSGGWASAGAPPAGNARYVRCTISRDGISPWFMQVLGFGDQSVSALATASLARAQTACAIPMALCATAGAPDFGYVPGDWYGVDFSDNGSSVTNYTGNFRWIDFDPSAPTPGCSGHGASELACLLAGTGQCSLPTPPTGGCTGSGSSGTTPGCVGETGNITSMQSAYNARFGLYRGGGGNPGLTDSPPDFTGYSYSTENWAAGRNAYANFRSAQAAHLPANNDPAVSPPFYSNPYRPSTTEEHATRGAERRVVVMPIVECAGFASGQQAPIRAYACVLMLDPYRKQGNDVKSRIEYLGRADQPGSPCATSGIPGDAGSQGPMVPSLVQ